MPRTLKQMKKLLNYMHNRWGRRGSTPLKKHSSYTWDHGDVGGLEHKEEYERFTMRVPHDKIVYSQFDFDHKNVEKLATKMAKGEFKEIGEYLPPRFLQRGKYFHIVDGHHRVLANKINKKTHTLGIVWKPKLKAKIKYGVKAVIAKLRDR